MSGEAGARGIVLDASDNVATLPWGGQKGESLLMPQDASGRPVPILAADIPAGHKCALRPIAAGAEVVKYGHPIGRAVAPIDPGAHVHVQNMQSRLSPKSSPAPDADPDGPAARIAPAALQTALAAVLSAAGAGDDQAQDIADHLVAAEASGVDTHGLRRLTPLVARLRSGGIDGTAQPDIRRDGAILSIDGRNGPGHHVARIAADAAIGIARELGVGVALVRGSTHFGFAGHYAGRIAEAGMVGLAISNGQVLVGPPGARRAIFSNDPIAVAAPMGETMFEFDMATSVTSRARIAQAAESGRPIAEGLALDADGRPTTDAARALEGILLPMGGAKGFGLIAALEVLTGVLPGGAYADQVASKEAAPDRPEGTSHFLMAIAPEATGGAESLADRMQDLAARVRSLPMADGAAQARMPGDRRAELRTAALRDGIALAPPILEMLRRLADEASVRLEFTTEDGG